MLHMPLFDQGGRWTGQWSERAVEPYVTPTLASLRATSRYYVVSDAQLKRDLTGRTLADVYRDNHAGRIGIANCSVTQYSPKFGKYEPRTMYGPSIAHGPHCGGQTLLEEYLADCYARGHEPHPASIDPDHPQNAHRLKAPKRESC